MLFRLVRLRLSLMVTFSAVTGYLLTGSRPDASLLCLVAGLFLLSSGASVLNQVQEQRQDALMPRTAGRPIPAGEIRPLRATFLALFLIVGGAALLSLDGRVPALLGLLNVAIYNLVYTPLKSRSWLAIVPGAVVGGVPPMIGWSAAGWSLWHPMALFLFLFVCMWQVPHFWLLMIRYGKEYESAGFSSITKILTEAQVKKVVFAWGVATSVFLMLFPLFGFAMKPGLLAVLEIANLGFIGAFYRFLFYEKSPRTVRKAFILINSYALTVFILLIINSL